MQKSTGILIIGKWQKRLCVDAHARAAGAHDHIDYRNLRGLLAQRTTVLQVGYQLGQQSTVVATIAKCELQWPTVVYLN